MADNWISVKVHKGFTNATYGTLYKIETFSDLLEQLPTSILILFIRYLDQISNESIEYGMVIYF